MTTGAATRPMSAPRAPPGIATPNEANFWVRAIRFDRPPKTANAYTNAKTTATTQPARLRRRLPVGVPSIAAAVTLVSRHEGPRNEHDNADDQPEDARSHRTLRAQQQRGDEPERRRENRQHSEHGLHDSAEPITSRRVAQKTDQPADRVEKQYSAEDAEGDQRCRTEG